MMEEFPVMVTVRPMLPHDVAEAEAAWDRTYQTMLVAHHLPTGERTPELVELRRRRIVHLLSTDPEGSWVAESRGAIVGVAQAHLRGDRWVLATLGVLPEHQDRQVGRELLGRTLDYGRSSTLGAVFSSPDHRAVHRYASAGFDLQPSAVGSGPARHPVDAPPGVRVGSMGDISVVDAIDRRVRGGTRSADIDFQLGCGARLLLADEEGYALVRGGFVWALTATTESAARRLLQTAVAQLPDGEPVSVSWITGRQQWAFRVLAEAGVSLSVHEAVMTRGPWEPDLPYLPSGIFG
jgi:ribosomal protein S18 acetylase RimI-like enzyme